MSTTLIPPCEFNSAVQKMREYFLSKGFIEVHTQSALSILAACEDPGTISTYNYAGKIWPLPQTGQMWLEHVLLENPEINWVSLGKSLGAESFTTLTIEDFRKVFSSVVKEPGPSLIEVRF